MIRKKQERSPPSFVQLHGRWNLDGRNATFLQPKERGNPVGMCLSPLRLRSGTASVRATLKDLDGAARVLLGFNAATGTYYSVGLGGYDFAYVIDLFTPGSGWRAVQAIGSKNQLNSEQSYQLRVDVSGQRVSLAVDDVRVLDHKLPAPLQGDQTGLFAWGNGIVEFSDFVVAAHEPRIFVVMQFGEPYDSLYKEVIQPICGAAGFKALRGDDVFRPGVILQDIRRGIVESDVIIAEITPVNANVFYELGYAHALEKPTILLANRNGEKLPFDISGYRVIFYDDTIRGKRGVEDTLRKHLESIRSGEDVV
jgi:hypothetical protein